MLIYTLKFNKHFFLIQNYCYYKIYMKKKIESIFFIIYNYR